MNKDEIKALKMDLLDYGMVSEIFPEYISTEGLSKITKKVDTINKESIPLKIYIPKDDGGIRNIYLPNPVSYINLVNTLFNENKIIDDLLQKIENNPYSHSKLLYDDHLFNIPIKEHKSNYMKSQNEKMVLSIGRHYCIKYDLEKFYDSIYTHYIPAGLYGYEKAINMYRENENKTSEYKYLEKIDKATRMMNSNETKGIITGPFTSRIISELIQSQIDTEITQQIKNITLRRYVDDAVIYCNTLDEANRNLEKIKKIYDKYKLSIKIEKTSISSFPFIDFSQVKDLIKINREKKINNNKMYFADKNDLFKSIQKAEDELKYYQRKGALKYLFKTLSKQKNEYVEDLSNKKKNASIFYLINYMIKYPQYSKYITKILNENMSDIDGTQSIILDTLKQTINNEQYIATLYVLEIIFYNNIYIPKKIIEEILNEENYASEITKDVILEYICSHNVKLYDSLIENFCKKMFNKKNKMDFKTDNWLAKYILYYYDFVSDNDIDQDIYYEYFKTWKDNKFRFIRIN
jgi:hypothetical protein